MARNSGCFRLVFVVAVRPWTSHCSKIKKNNSKFAIFDNKNIFYTHFLIFAGSISIMHGPLFAWQCACVSEDGGRPEAKMVERGKSTAPRKLVQLCLAPRNTTGAPGVSGSVCRYLVCLGPLSLFLDQSLSDLVQSFSKLCICYCMSKMAISQHFMCFFWHFDSDPLSQLPQFVHQKPT